MKKENIFIEKLIETLWKEKNTIIDASRKDVVLAKRKKLSEVFIKRLTFDLHSLEQLLLRLKDVQRLESGIGEIIEEKVNEVGLRLQKVRVPIGTILVVYEARPDVTVDVAVLCIKSGNKTILKGGSEALNTNKALFTCIQLALYEAGLSQNLVKLLRFKDRNALYKLLRKDLIDLVIARGGYDMVRAIQDESKIPVLAHAAGGARIYIDKSADISIVEKILINAKTTKPSACNSLDTIVIHKGLAQTLLSKIKQFLTERRIQIINNAWDKEFLDLKISIKIVEDLDEAIKFVNKYSKKHSEGIIAQDGKVIKRFTDSVDAAAIFVNSSTRLHDGYIFGLGSEMGIATGKLHARGPVGLKELTSYKWIAYGNGQIRE